MVIETLIEKLNTIGLPVFLQGSLSADTQYPDNFFTYWNNDTRDLKHYDNKSAGIVWDFDVNTYGSDPLIVLENMNEAIRILKSAGFIIGGAGYTVASDEATHTGRGVNVLFIERR